MADTTSVETLVGRRVEIHGLISPKGQQLNGQLGTVISELDVGRLGVRLKQGTESISRSNILLRPLTAFELNAGCLPKVVETWPVEAVLFFNSQQHYFTADPEEGASRMILDDMLRFTETPRYSPVSILVDDCRPTLLLLVRHGLLLDGLLKVTLRRLAGIYPYSPNVLNPNSVGKKEHTDLTHLLHASQAAGRETELVKKFDSMDLLRAVLAADRSGCQFTWKDPFFGCSGFQADFRQGLTALVNLLFNCGVSIRCLAQQAKTMFHELLTENLSETTPFSSSSPIGFWLRDQLNQERFDRRVDRWCRWEQHQWCLTASTFGNRGLRLPGTVAVLIADCIAGTEAVSTQDAGSPILQVLQEVNHNEPAQHIDQEVARAALQLESDEAWAQQVEQHISRGEHLKADAALQVSCEWTEVSTSERGSDVEIWNSRPSDFGETIYILGFTRCGAQLKQALQEGRELEDIRIAADNHGQSCLLKSGAGIFVYPNQYQPILSVLGQSRLKPHQVIVSEAFLPLVYREVAKLPSRANIRPCSLKTIALIDGDTSEYICVVERTFFNAAPHQRCDVDAVTQSTSQAHGVQNPRSKSSM